MLEYLMMLKPRFGFLERPLSLPSPRKLDKIMPIPGRSFNER
jgi:hypothetical protein